MLSSYHRRKINKSKSTRDARIVFFDHTDMAKGPPFSLVKVTEDEMSPMR